MVICWYIRFVVIFNLHDTLCKRIQRVIVDVHDDQVYWVFDFSQLKHSVAAEVMLMCNDLYFIQNN